MDEIEVKVVEEDFSVIRTSVKKLGGKKTFDGKMKTYYLDTPNFRFKKGKKVLRLRWKEGDEFWVLGFKSTKEDDSISRYDEHEVSVEDGKVLLEIFKHAGFVISDCIEKHRLVFDFDDGEIVFDKLLGKYKQIPEYMEIEAESKPIIRKYLKALKIRKQNVHAWNSHQLIDHYMKSASLFEVLRTID